MGISTKSTYGIRAMFELALYYERGPISVTYISEKENISVPYLEQLLNQLRRNGLVKSVRGPKGGYVLAKRPAEITVGNVVSALDGDIMQVHCAYNKTSNTDCAADRTPNNNCTISDKCVTKRVWKKLKDTAEDLLDSVTLSDLCEDAEEMRMHNE